MSENLFLFLYSNLHRLIYIRYTAVRYPPNFNYFWAQTRHKC